MRVQRSMNTPNVAEVNKHFNSVQTQYLVYIESKYSSNISITHRDRQNTAWHFHDSNLDKNIDINTFIPCDFGFELGCVIDNNKTMLKLNVKTLQETSQENIETRKIVKEFSYPDAKTTKKHVIVHGIDEIVGFEDNKLGSGFIVFCTHSCRPFFKWFRNNELFKQGHCIFWLPLLPPPVESHEDICYCEVTCDKGCKVMSKKLKMSTEQIFSIKLNVKNIKEISNKASTISEEVIGYGQQAKVYKGFYEGKEVAIKKVILNRRNVKKYRMKSI